MANIYPSVYQPKEGKDIINLSLAFINYGPEGNYSIGKDAVPQTVSFYRNGFLDTLAVYNPENGLVTPSVEIGIADSIRITWAKTGEEQAFGSLSTAIALLNDDKKPVGYGVSMSSRWSILGGTWSEYDRRYPGHIMLSAWYGYKKPDLELSLSAGSGFRQPDTSLFYRIEGFEGSSFFIELANMTSLQAGASSNPEIAFLQIQNKKELLFRDFSNSSIWGTTWSGFDSGADLIIGKIGPYPVYDTITESKVISAEYSLMPDEWAGFQVSIEGIKEALTTIHRIEIPVLFRSANDRKNLRLCIQSGVLSSPDEWTAEYPAINFFRNLISTN